jgi:hypothetical protein
MLKEGCRWFQLFFIYFSNFILLTRILINSKDLPENFNLWTLSKKLHLSTHLTLLHSTCNFHFDLYFFQNEIWNSHFKSNYTVRFNCLTDGQILYTYNKKNENTILISQRLKINYLALKYWILRRIKLSIPCARNFPNASFIWRHFIAPFYKSFTEHVIFCIWFTVKGCVNSILVLVDSFEYWHAPSL